MNVIPVNSLNRAIEILGASDEKEYDAYDQLGKLVSDPIDIERLAVWPPEAFALVLIAHNWDLETPDSFSAKSANGEWKQFSLRSEPVFIESLKIATSMFHNGSEAIFGNVVRRSAMLDTVNKALNSNESLTGATLGGPALLGIPAEYYQKKETPEESSANMGVFSKLLPWLRR